MADKSFGVDQLDILGTGTPTISAPNQLNLDAHTVAISTSVTVGEGMSAVNISATGISTIAQPANSNPMANWTITNNSASAYRFTGPGQSGSDDNPDLYLVRGHRYIFKHNATTNHPIQIRVASGGAAYTDGITYSDTSNNRTTDGNNLIINLQHDAPARLFYQCTSHGSMVGNIYTVGGPQVISGVVTATTFVGNLTGNPTGTLQTAAQPNITSVGTLSALTVSGNINVSSTDPTIVFVDSDNNSDFDIKAGGGRFAIRDSTNNAERLRIDSNGKIGINLTNPGDYNSSANNLVVHSSPSVNDAGITIRSNYAGTGGLYFADGTGTSSDKGYIAYGQSNDTMYFGVNRGSKLQINSSGAFGLAGSNYGSSGQVLTSQGSGSAPQWATPSSGVSVADQWRLTSGQTITTQDVVLTNWERPDTSGTGGGAYLGGGMSQSSGVFSFPTTGIYLITFEGCFNGTNNTRYSEIDIVVTKNNSTYVEASRSFFYYNRPTGTSTGASCSCSFIMDVDNISNDKVRFESSQDNVGQHQVLGDSGTNLTTVTFLRLGDT